MSVGPISLFWLLPRDRAWASLSDSLRIWARGLCLARTLSLSLSPSLSLSLSRSRCRPVVASGAPSFGSKVCVQGTPELELMVEKSGHKLKLEVLRSASQSIGRGGLVLRSGNAAEFAIIWQDASDGLLKGLRSASCSDSWLLLLHHSIARARRRPVSVRKGVQTGDLALAECLTLMVRLTGPQMSTDCESRLCVIFSVISLHRLTRYS